MERMRGAVSVTEALICVVLALLIVYLAQNLNFH